MSEVQERPVVGTSLGTAPEHEPQASSWVTTAARWVVPYLLLAGALVAVARTAASPPSNIDTFFHLRFGHEFLSGWSLRHPGHPTSYATADWVPTQWLSQVLMARTEDRFGLAGIAWLSGALFTALLVSLYAATRRVSDAVVAAPVVVVTLIGCASGLSMRPQVVSYVLVVVTVTAWLRAFETGRAPWHLVPLTWLWAMCHGMWPLGVVIGVVAALALVADGRAAGRRALAVLAAPVLAGAAGALLTPVGPPLLGATLLVSSRGDYFSEWAPPDFTTLQPLVVLGTLVLTWVLMARSSAPQTWSRIALVGLATGFLAYSQRTVPVAACLLAPLVAGQVQTLVGTRRHVRRSEVVGATAAPIVALALLAALVPATASEPLRQPAWVDSRLQALPTGARVLGPMGYGGYLMWRYPDLDVLFSGYGDVYTDEELEDMTAIADLAPGWDRLLARARPDVALLPPDSPLAYALRTSAGWEVAEDSEDVQLLVPPPDSAGSAGDD